MSFGKDPIIERKMELDRNPAGTHLKVAQQREREKTGRYVAIPATKHVRGFSFAMVRTRKRE